MRSIKKDSTDQSVVIRIIDSTDGTPENSVEYNTAGIDLWYRREGATKTSIVEVALAALDSAHLDGGIELIGDGYYRLDPPDAAFATGANGVMIGGTVTGMIVIGTYIPLVDYDPQDTVRLGLTALPNAAADAAGGIPVSDAGNLDLDTKLANTNEITAARMGALTDLINGERLDLLIDQILADTNELQTNQGAWATAAGFSTHSAADVKTAIEAAGSSIAQILADTDNLQTNQGAWLTATGFSTHSAADVKTAIEAAGSSIATILADTNELQTDWANGGRLDLLIDAILTDTGTTLDTKLDTILGLNQENFFIDTTTYSGGNMTGARIRIYSVAGSVGTASDVIATYTITATYSGSEMTDYKVVKS